jgi:general secretion pathway protein M
MIFTSVKKRLSSIREKSGYDQLEPREKFLVRYGGIFCVVFLLFQFVVSPYLSARQHLARSVREKKTELVKIIALQKRYRQLQGIVSNGANGIAARGAGFSLFSFVEEQALRADIKKQMSSMRPLPVEEKSSGSAVEIKLQRVSLGRLVAFLQLVEDPDKMVFVQTLSIQESTRVNFVDVILQIATQGR